MDRRSLQEISIFFLLQSIKSWNHWRSLEEFLEPVYTGLVISDPSDDNNHHSIPAGRGDISEMDHHHGHMDCAKWGVPQGSVCGTPSFLVLINTYVSLYADDTVVHGGVNLFGLRNISNGNKPVQWQYGSRFLSQQKFGLSKPLLHLYF